MKSVIKYVALVHLLSFLAIFGQNQLSNNPFPLYPDGEVKNVILMIGDGMGIGQITSVRLQRIGRDGYLNIEKFPVTGLVRTHSADDIITDSGASATALASGYKTNSLMVGMTPDSVSVVTLLEAFAKTGKKTGLIVTSGITHATPACFAAHVSSRWMYDQIAVEMIETGPDIMLGGGLKHFIPNSMDSISRKDEINVLEMAEEKGYTILKTKDDLNETSATQLLGLFNIGALKHDSLEPTLSEMTQKGLEVLKNHSEGFFLMVEGSQIDWASHDNDFAYLQREMLSFDQAIRVAVDFAIENGNTLVLVTADHETGGLTIDDGKEKDVRLKWASKHHSGTMVPIFAFGPHAQRFSGVLDNTDIPKIIADITGLKDFPQKQSR